MLSSRELTRKIEEANRKLTEHQREVAWQLKELEILHQDLKHVTMAEADEARKSMKKVA